MSSYYVYMMSNTSRMLYVGITNDLSRRVHEHKAKLLEGFTRKYNLHQLIWFEETPNVRAAIAREKQIKGWARAKKIMLIEASNPEWNDRASQWYDGK